MSCCVKLRTRSSSLPRYVYVHDGDPTQHCTHPRSRELFSPKARTYRRFAKSTRPIGTIINAALCRPYFLIRVFY